jgi:hypothetical protein
MYRVPVRVAVDAALPVPAVWPRACVAGGPAAVGVGGRGLPPADSVTAGTVLHKTYTSLHVWFWSAHLVCTATPGISAAVQLQRQLGLNRDETAWMMLHKLRGRW